jgi:hypothetical protein
MMEAMGKGGLESRWLLHFMLLLVQQLQAATPQQRAAFLHSPAGTILLHVLHGMSLPEVEDRFLCELLVQDSNPPSSSAAAGAEAVAAEPAAGQQGYPAAGNWSNSVPRGREVVQLLLLPALLLAPVPGAVAGAAHGSSPRLVMCVQGESPPRLQARTLPEQVTAA